MCKHFECKNVYTEHTNNIYLYFQTYYAYLKLSPCNYPMFRPYVCYAYVYISWSLKILQISQFYQIYCKCTSVNLDF